MDFIALRNELHTMRPQSRKHNRHNKHGKKKRNNDNNRTQREDGGGDAYDIDDDHEDDLFLEPTDKNGVVVEQLQLFQHGDDDDHHQALGSPKLTDPTLRAGGLSAELRVDPEAKMKLRQKYEITKEEIGRGAYGRVVKATNRLTGAPIAIKIIDKNKISERHLSELNCEVETLTLLHHKNVVGLEDVYQDDKTMFICMEYVAGGCLSVTLRQEKQFPEMIVRQMGLHFLQAISHIHAKGIVHRDLKPANVLLTQKWISAAEKRRQQEEQRAIEKENHERTGSNNNEEATATVTATTGTSKANNSSNNKNNNTGMDRVIGAVGRMTSYSSQGSGTPTTGSRTKQQQNHHQQQGKSPTTTTSSTHGSSSNSNVGGGGGSAYNPYCSLKIADFGFAVMVGFDDCLTHYCGTTAYMAPEIIEKQQYGKSVDMWSFGVILFQLLSGGLPFTGSSSDGSLQQNIYEGSFTFSKNPVFNTITPAAKDLISKLLVLDPAKRLTAKEAMGHVWIRAALMSPEELEASMILYSPTNSMRAIGSYALHKKKRTRKTRIKGLVICVMAAHRMVFLSKVKQLEKVGAGGVPVLRSFSFHVSGVFEPEARSITAGRPCYSNAAALHQLTSMIGASRTVKTYDISCNGIDSMDLIQHIVKISVGHQSLTTLNMSNNPIPPLAGRALIRLARSASSLTTINVNNTNLGRDVIVQIGTDLKVNERKRAETARAAPSYGLGGFGSPVSNVSISSSPFGSPVAFAQRFDATPFTKSLSQKRRKEGGQPTSSSASFQQHQQNSVQRRLEGDLSGDGDSGGGAGTTTTTQTPPTGTVRTIKTTTMTIFSSSNTTTATATAKEKEGKRSTPPPPTQQGNTSSGVGSGVKKASSSSSSNNNKPSSGERLPKYHSTVDELESYLGTSLSSLLQRPKNPASNDDGGSEPSSLANTGTFTELPVTPEKEKHRATRATIKTDLLVEPDSFGSPLGSVGSGTSSPSNRIKRSSGGAAGAMFVPRDRGQQQQQQQSHQTSSSPGPAGGIATSSYRKGTISKTMQQHQQQSSAHNPEMPINLLTRRSSSQNSSPQNGITSTTQMATATSAQQLNQPHRRAQSSLDNPNTITSPELLHTSFGSPGGGGQRNTNNSSNTSGKAPRISLLPPSVAYSSPTGGARSGGAGSRTSSVSSPLNATTAQHRQLSVSPPGRSPIHNNSNNNSGSPSLPPLGNSSFASGGGGGSSPSFAMNQRSLKK